MGCTPSENPEWWKQMNPMERNTLYTRDIILAHGKNDEDVPMAMSNNFCKKFSNAIMLRLPGDHYSIVNPEVR
eukprot:UN01687